jgi:3-hydroxyacyl-CoA dehydrogenase/enoyl-CoA hydratase/3-hydroxybutyryl-CoA epimerase
MGSSHRLTLDDPTQSANTMNALYQKSMGETVARCRPKKPSIGGIIVTSAKKTFFAGGDLDLLMQVTPAHAARISERLE